LKVNLALESIYKGGEGHREQEVKNALEIFKWCLRQLPMKTTKTSASLHLKKEHFSKRANTQKTT
jgi:hypothetical protein